HARGPVVVQVLLDLGPPPAGGRLVDRELHPARPVDADLGHEGRVLRGDVLVREVDHLRHAEDVLVLADPLLHPAQLDVADDVVDVAYADAVPASAPPPARATVRTPSPWRRTCSAISPSGPSGAVTTQRTRPCSSTHDTRSRTPVSSPAYATGVNPIACV